MSKHTRNTKIVATLGPASCTPEMIRGLIDRGMNFARINGSHGTHEQHAQTIRLVREASDELGVAVGVLFDLQGPKIRLGMLTTPRPVTLGETVIFTVDTDRQPDDPRVPVTHANLPTDVGVGDRLLIDDGQVATVVLAVEGNDVHCKILNDGTLDSRKGINLPNSVVSIPSLTDKDRADALFAVEQEVEVIALSFVRRREDVQELAQIIEKAGSTIPIIAKIEKPQALDNLDEILEECWGVMVARGDLGVELPPEEVPMAQKEIIRRASQAGRPVITATQMLDSMIRNPRPTRAEASDVANAVLDGTDAVMLSGETATGRYPLESVEMMDRVIRATEKNSMTSPMLRRRERCIDSISDAVADAGQQVAHHLHTQAIAAFTQSGRTAILASKRRPDVPLVAFSYSPEVRRRLSLVWGVDSYQLPATQNTDRLVRELDMSLIEHEVAKRGDRVVLLMGAPTWRSGVTNLLVVHEVGSW